MDVLDTLKGKQLEENKEGLKNFKKWVNGEKINKKQLQSIQWLIADFQAKTDGF